MKRYTICLLPVLFVLVALLNGCSSDSSSGQPNTGTLSLSLVDAPTDAYQAVYVTIDKVQAHLGDVNGGGGGDNNWITVATPMKTYNLLDLVNGTMESLGVTDLKSGTYTQMRLYLGSAPDDSKNVLNQPHPYSNYVIDKQDSGVNELSVPSEYQSGIKLVQEFDIVSGRTVDLALDFDAESSVVKAGNSGQYLLKPVIKVVDTADKAMLSGLVTDDHQKGLEGVRVSAQTYHPDATDVKYRVVIHASTLTDKAGRYMMYLEPGTYNIVTVSTGYYPSCSSITTKLNGDYTQAFELVSADTGNALGTVSITDSDESAGATLSFRQTGQCNDGLQEIEVYAVTVSNGLDSELNVVAGEYDVSLPVDDYQLVASSEGRTTQVVDSVEIQNGAETRVDIMFP